MAVEEDAPTAPIATKHDSDFPGQEEIADPQRVGLVCYFQHLVLCGGFQTVDECHERRDRRAVGMRLMA
jgi:hypothetical protein